MSMGSHQSTAPQTDTWLTPQHIIQSLGPFDLDPCCPPDMPWRTATRMVSLPEDGLSAEWQGTVWLNPTWGPKSAPWMKKMSEHGNGISLIPARTETIYFQRYVWMTASSLLFMAGRPAFYRPDGTTAKFNCGCPVVLAAYGMECSERLQNCHIPGALVSGWQVYTPDPPRKFPEYPSVQPPLL